ncbi:enoyl-CoA hydratase/isomerase family protein [Pseudomonas akapageensis]|uniref:enoyl-CoA hydratase/isomerase family protein n=1 Tax=Pseudomonas akapageensis TaxID=2609961 RepID=UPI00140A4E1E|nr:enoyl-CoA hydratase/isomerase family protein [Pseudomonas akapageensis]
MPNDHKQLSVHRETPAIWRVSFYHPPINLVDHDTLLELQNLASAIEASAELKVVIIDSADPDFFLAHWDIASVARPLPAGTPPPSWIDISLRLAQSPVVTIGLIRGRARGMGSEIALGLDLRFASIERAIFGQPEVGVGLVPGGGAMERLPLLTGRARALEIVLGAGDFDASTAERYGWINRALPDAQLDTFVRDLAQRLASFDKAALGEAKQAINRSTLPNSDDLKASQALFYKAFGRPGTQSRVKALMERGIGTRSDLEMRFGEHLPNLISPAQP